MAKGESIYDATQLNLFNKNKSVISSISAIEKADNGDFERAINEFSKIISLNPDDANSYFARATLKVRIGDIEGARHDFKMSEICRRKNNLTSDKYPLV